MKKLALIILISSMLVTSLTACTNNGNSSDSGQSSSAPENSSPESSDTGSSTPENSGSSDISDSPIAPDGSLPDNGDLPDDGNEEGVDNSDLAFPDSKAGNMVKAALAVDAWPSMALIEDQEMVDALFYDRGIVLDNYEEFCLTSNFMSGQLNNVLVIKPKAGSESEVETVFNNYMEALKTDQNLTFYPAQEQSAAGAVQGKTDDGYYYLIVHEKGADIESGMLAAL